MPLRRPALVFVLLAAWAGCGRPEAEQTRRNPNDAAPPAPAPSPTPTPAPPPRAAEWELTATHYGPIRFGMTVAEARAAVPGGWEAPDGPGGCAYISIPGAPPATSFMIENGRVVRVNINAAGPTTAEGVGVGDTEDRVRAAYTGRVREEPHKYTSGRYLIVAPSAPSDSMFRIVFETDGARVTRYRAGTRPQVEYVEGCA